ncbi:MAG: hypothetical protein DRP78_04395 [Candidatus Omnitrophota bacterium]|nr:MAG: hypothetical protein DRP78_04395 [Candidatus Omnitrophota bacterium]
MMSLEASKYIFLQIFKNFGLGFMYIILLKWDGALLVDGRYCMGLDGIFVFQNIHMQRGFISIEL